MSAKVRDKSDEKVAKNDYPNFGHKRIYINIIYIIWGAAPSGPNVPKKFFLEKA